MAMLAKDSVLTKGAQVGAEVTALFRARYGALWISTVEEARAESILVESAARAKLSAIGQCAGGETATCLDGARPVSPDRITQVQS